MLKDELVELDGELEQAERTKAKRPAIIIFLSINKIFPLTAHTVNSQTLVLGCILGELCHTNLANKQGEPLENY